MLSLLVNLKAFVCLLILFIFHDLIRVFRAGVVGEVKVEGHATGMRECLPTDGSQDGVSPVNIP
eukprot:1470922-Karenia_brevis.AAC.1